MNSNTKSLSFIFIILVLLLLWTRSFLGNGLSLMGIGFLLIVVALAFGSTCFLYRNEWRQVLGIKTKGITGKIILKAFFGGLLINIVCNVIIILGYQIIFKEAFSSPFNEHNLLKFLILALVMAPLTEEFLFRGFIQGLWQKLYSEKEKLPAKLIIVVTALLFSVSHFSFLYNISFKQFFFSAISIFVVALYFGWLRHKHQSIIPSIFAHFGANATMIIMIPITIMITTVMPNQISNFRYNIEVSQYKNDTIPYNFDPNDMAEWERSYKKFSTIERPRSEEFVKHLKGIATNIHVYFTIDTCGLIYNINVGEGVDSFYIKQYGYDYARDAMQFIKSMPLCKPYIEDGKKVEKEMCVSVPLYPF